jgi:Tfp pilus assembly protein PilF
MKLVNRVLPFLIVFAMVALPLAAQDSASPTGEINGTVLGFDSNALAGAVLELNVNGETVRVVTGPDGKYTHMLPPGSYTGRLRIQGVVLTEETFDVAVNRPVTTDFDLGALSPADKEAAREMIEGGGRANAAREAFQLGREALTSGNYAEAVTQFELAAENDNQHVILANLAQAYTGAGRFEDAAAQYRLALEQAPDNAVYHQNLGIVLGNSGDIDGAVASITQSATLDPTTESPAYYNLGLIFTNRGQMTEAVDAFKRSIAADANNAPAYYQLGLALVGTAPADAVTPLERFLELAPNDPNAVTAQGLLDFAKTQ